MKTNRTNLWLSLSALLLVGCATAPKPRDIVTSTSFNDEHEAVWSATVGVLAEMNLPVLSADAASGLITTDWMNITGSGNNEFCDCGGTGIFTELKREGRWSVLVQRSTTGSDVRVNSMYRQSLYTGLDDAASSSIRNCLSTGNVEAAIHRNVAKKLGPSSEGTPTVGDSD